MSLFKKFPLAVYDFTGKSSKQNIVDIFRNVKLNDSESDEVAIYQKYSIDDGDRPDVVSERLYGDSSYYWTFFYLNDSLREGLSAWPKSHVEMERHFELAYDSVSILEFKTSIQFGPALHFSNGSYFNYINSLVGYPFKENGYVKGYNSDDILIAEGAYVSFDINLNQLRMTPVSGEFGNTQKIYVEASSDAELVEWFIKFRPLDYDNIYLANSNPQLVIPEDGSASYYTYTPNSSAILAAIKTTPLICHRAHLSARNAPHHFEDEDGEIINTFLQGSSEHEENNFEIVTNYEYETAINDEKRSIRVLAPAAVLSFSDTFQDSINA